VRIDHFSTSFTIPDVRHSTQDLEKMKAFGKNYEKLYSKIFRYPFNFLHEEQHALRKANFATPNINLLTFYYNTRAFDRIFESKAEDSFESKKLIILAKERVGSIEESLSLYGELEGKKENDLELQICLMRLYGKTNNLPDAANIRNKFLLHSDDVSINFIDSCLMAQDYQNFRLYLDYLKSSDVEKTFSFFQKILASELFGLLRLNRLKEMEKLLDDLSMASPQLKPLFYTSENNPMPVLFDQFKASSNYLAFSLVLKKIYWELIENVDDENCYLDSLIQGANIIASHYEIEDYETLFKTLRQNVKESMENTIIRDPFKAKFIFNPSEFEEYERFVGKYPSPVVFRNEINSLGKKQLQFE
jgi:hypothetical protein